MRHYSDTEVDGLRDYDSGATFSGYRFERCRFGGCILFAHAPSTRATVRDVVLRDCVDGSSAVSGCIIEDVVVDGLKTHQPLQLWGCAWKHVVLRGRLGSIMLSPFARPDLLPLDPDGVNAAFRYANACYYRTVDWSIDVREAQAKDIELSGVPARLVRRDPDRSIMVTRQAVESCDWRLPGVVGTCCEIGIERIFDFSLDDIVLVACGRPRQMKEDLRAFEVLRREGIAEPD